MKKKLKNYMLSVRIDDALAKALNKICARNAWSRSKVLRAIVKDWVEEHE